MSHATGNALKVFGSESDQRPTAGQSNTLSPAHHNRQNSSTSPPESILTRGYSLDKKFPTQVCFFLVVVLPFCLVPCFSMLLCFVGTTKSCIYALWYLQICLFWDSFFFHYSLKNVLFFLLQKWWCCRAICWPHSMLIAQRFLLFASGFKFRAQANSVGPLFAGLNVRIVS